MNWLIIILFPFLGGLIQTVSGFGGGIVMMLVFPYFFPWLQAPALSSAIGLILSGSLTFQFWNKIDFRKAAVPTLIFTVISVLSVRFSKMVDINVAGLIYGLFLIMLAAYYFFFSKRKIKGSGNVKMAICSTLSGIASGFFGIGGPMMAIYYTDVLTDNLTYLATSQFNFFFGNVISFVTRIVSGIYTAELIPYTLLGFASIFAGRQLGLRIINKIDGNQLKRIVYILVAVAGLISVIKYGLR